MVERGGYFTTISTANVHQFENLNRQSGNKKYFRECGFNNFNFDQNVIQTTTPNDLSFTFDDEGEFLPNIGFGFYYHSPRWYAGFSVPWFIENESFNIQRHYFGIIGGLVRISNSF